MLQVNFIVIKSAEHKTNDFYMNVLVLHCALKKQTLMITTDVSMSLWHHCQGNENKEYKFCMLILQTKVCTQNEVLTDWLLMQQQTLPVFHKGI